MKKFIIFLYIFLIINFSLHSEEEKIQIFVSEIKEEVPKYRTFNLRIVNPANIEKTIIARIIFDSGEVCYFLAELKPYEQKEQVRHCKVPKRKTGYKVEVEKIYDFVIE